MATSGSASASGAVKKVKQAAAFVDDTDDGASGSGPTPGQTRRLPVFRRLPTWARPVATVRPTPVVREEEEVYAYAAVSEPRFYATPVEDWEAEYEPRFYATPVEDWEAEYQPWFH